MTEPLDLEPIKARLAGAPPGPWEWSHAYNFDDRRGKDAVDDSGRASLVAPDGSRVLAEWASWADDSGLDVEWPVADLIANAPTDIAALIAEVERLRLALLISGEGFDRRGGIIDNLTLENLRLREALDAADETYGY